MSFEQHYWICPTCDAANTAGKEVEHTDFLDCKACGASTAAKLKTFSEMRLGWLMDSATRLLSRLNACNRMDPSIYLAGAILKVEAAIDLIEKRIDEVK